MVWTRVPAPVLLLLDVSATGQALFLTNDVDVDATGVTQALVLVVTPGQTALLRQERTVSGTRPGVPFWSVTREYWYTEQHGWRSPQDLAGAFPLLTPPAVFHGRSTLCVGALDQLPGPDVVVAGEFEATNTHAWQYSEQGARETHPDYDWSTTSGVPVAVATQQVQAVGFPGVSSRGEAPDAMVYVTDACCGHGRGVMVLTQSARHLVYNASAAESAVTFAVLDVDTDGTEDVVVLEDDSVSVFLNNGTTLLPHMASSSVAADQGRRVASAAAAIGIAAIHYDDGDTLDILGDGVVLRNQFPGPWEVVAASITSGHFALGAVSGDFNGDGYRDVASNGRIVTSSGNEKLRLFRVTSSPSATVHAAGDIDGDGVDELIAVHAAATRVDGTEHLVLVYYYPDILVYLFVALGVVALIAVAAGACYLVRGSRLQEDDSGAPSSSFLDCGFLSQSKLSGVQQSAARTPEQPTSPHHSMARGDRSDSKDGDEVAPRGGESRIPTVYL